MADVRRVIELVFGATDNATQTIDKLSTNLGNITAGVQATTGPIADITEGFLKFEAAVLAGALAVGGIAVNEAIKFQAASLDLEKVLGDSTKTIEEFKQAGIDLSSTYGVASTDVLASAANFKQAGFDAEEALLLVEASLKAVNISELDAATASEALIRILKGFNAPASEVDHILDAVNATTNNFAANFGQLTEALARSAPIANQAGVGIDQLIGFLTPGIEIFQNGEIVARGFSTTLQRLGDDSQPVTDALRAIGVAQKDATRNLRTGGEILRDVQEAFIGLTPAQKGYITQQLAGIDAAKVAVTVFDGLSKTLEITANATNSTGSATNELKVRMKAVEVQGNIARESFRNLAIAVGSEFLPATSSVFKSLGDIANVLRTSLTSEAVRPFIDALVSGFEALALQLEGIVKALPDAISQLDFSGLLTALGNVSDEVASLFSADLTDADQLASVLQRLVNISETFVNVTKGILEAVIPVVTKIAEYAAAASDSDASTAELVGNILGLTTVVDKFLGPIQTLLTAVQGLAFAAGAKGAAGTLKTLGDIAAGTTTTLGKAGLVGAVAAGSFAIGTWLNGVLEANTGISEWNKSIASWNNGPTPEMLARLAELQAKTKAMKEAQTEVAGATEDTSREFEDSVEIFTQYAGLADDLGGTLKILEGGLVEITAAQRDVNTAVKASDPILEAARENLRQLGLDAELAEKGFSVLSRSGQDGIITFNGYTEANKKALTELEKTEKQLEEDAKKSVQFDLELAKLEARERELQFKVAGDIRVAEIQAQAEQVVAAFDSIGETVSATTDLIGNLASVFAEADSQAQRRLIEDLIQDQLDIQREQLDIQRELVKAQIDLIQAQTRALNSGDALIQIDGSGLAPELEAFMFAVLSAIQVKASGQGQQFLLGLGGA